MKKNNSWLLIITSILIILLVNSVKAGTSDCSFQQNATHMIVNGTQTCTYINSDRILEITNFTSTGFLQINSTGTTTITNSIITASTTNTPLTLNMNGLTIINTTITKIGANGANGGLKSTAASCTGNPGTTGTDTNIIINNTGETNITDSTIQTTGGNGGNGGSCDTYTCDSYDTSTGGAGATAGKANITILTTSLTTQNTLLKSIGGNGGTGNFGKCASTNPYPTSGVGRGGQGGQGGQATITINFNNQYTTTNTNIIITSGTGGDGGQGECYQTGGTSKCKCTARGGNGNIAGTATYILNDIIINEEQNSEIQITTGNSGDGGSTAVTYSPYDQKCIGGNGGNAAKPTATIKSISSFYENTQFNITTGNIGTGFINTDPDCNGCTHTNGADGAITYSEATWLIDYQFEAIGNSIFNLDTPPAAYHKINFTGNISNNFGIFNSSNFTNTLYLYCSQPLTYGTELPPNPNILIDGSCGIPTYVNYSQFSTFKTVLSSIYPQIVFENQTIYGYCQAMISQNPITYIWKWYKNGALHSSGVTNLTAPNILTNVTSVPPADVSPGDTFILECTANNTIYTSNSLNSTPLQIQYIPPTVANINFNPTINIPLYNYSILNAQWWNATATGGAVWLNSSYLNDGDWDTNGSYANYTNKYYYYNEIYDIPFGITQGLLEVKYGCGLGGGNTTPSTLTDNLVSYYTIDASNVTLTSFKDVTANALDGTKGANNEPTQQAGLFNESMYYDGVNDRGYIAANAKNNIFDNGENVTVSLWIKTSWNQMVNSNIGGVLFGKREWIDFDEWFFLLNFYNSTISFARWDDDGTSDIVFGNSAVNNLSDNTWHDIVGTVHANKTMILYIDGVKTASRDSNPTFDGPDNENILIGARKNNAGTWAYGYKGNIDEIGIWNKTLTQAEITELYNTGLGKAYPFGSGGGNTTINITRKNYTLPLSCLNNGDNRLQILMQGYASNGNNTYTDWGCWNGTAYQQILFKNCTTNPYTQYESAFHGNITKGIGSQTNISWNKSTDPYNGTMKYDVQGDVGGGWFDIVIGTFNNWYDWAVNVFYDGLATIRLRAVNNDTNGTSDWLSVEVYINSTNSTVVINQLYITPHHPIYTDQIDCNFNVTAPINNMTNALITWYKTYDNTTWTHINTSDYLYTNVTKNTLYTTGNGTGSIIGEQGIWAWKCEIKTYLDIYFENLGDYYYTIQNSTPSYPFSIDLISPPDMLASNKSINVSFKLIDLNGTNMGCSLHIDNTTKNVTGILHNTTTNITYTPALDGIYLWNLSCNTTQNPTMLYTETRTYIYDGHPPEFLSFYNNQTAMTPEIGDTIRLGTIIDDFYIIDTCQLWINATGVFVLETNYIINSTGPYNLTMNYTVTNASIKPYENVTWRVWCNDTAGNGNYSITQNFTVKDFTLPQIIIGNNTSFKTDNTTVISNAIHNLTLNITYYDYNLFQAEINVTCDINGTIYYWQNLSMNVTPAYKYNKFQEVPLTGIPLQKCTFFTSVSDDHTTQQINDYDITKLKDGLKFITDNGIIIDIISEEGQNKVEDKTTLKEKDRYKFGFKYNDKSFERNFIIRTNKPIYTRPNSEYPGHLVIWDEEKNTGNWIDFAEEGQENKEYIITKINDYEYNITIKAIIPENPIIEIQEEKGILEKIFGSEKEMTEEEILLENYGINDITFNSIGGLNINNATYHFYIGTLINISTLNIYDNQTFNQTAFPLTAKITTINSIYPINVTRTINYSYPYINDTLTLGNYTIEFYSPHYFNQTYNIEVTNNTQNLTYESFQSILYVRVYHVKTLANLTGLNITITNTNTTAQTNITNTTNIWTIFYLDRDPYNIIIQKQTYQDKNISFTMDYRENKTIETPLNFYAKFNFIDERTLGPFNIASADMINFLLFCPESTYTTLINQTNQTIPINCNYIKFKFILDYGPTSYYRTFILSPDEANNVNIFLINLNTTNAIYNSFHVDDLFNDYDNVRIYIKKIIDNATEQITADYVDIEDKVGAFLIENHEYIIEIHSDNHPVRIMGAYSADQSGDKNLRLYDISLNATTTGMQGTLFQIQTENRTGNETYALLRFQDIANTTTSITWSLYSGSIGGTLISQVMSTSKNFTAEQNVTAYANAPIYSKLDITTPTGIYHDTRLVYDTYKIVSEFVKEYETWIIWAITLIISMIAIMATIESANIAALAITGIAALFLAITWYPINAGALALVALVTLIMMLKKGDKNMGVR